MQRLFRQFSFPGGIPSHVAPETPGSIHEGGELGYALSHAFGAAFDNPDLLVACVVGDGEAETGPLATSWHSNKFLNPARDGAVLPILHLNGYKIADPTVLARIPRRRARCSSSRLRLGRRSSSRATTPADDARADGRRARRGARRDRDDPERRARGAERRRARAGRCSSCAHQRAGPARRGGRQAGRGHVARASGADSPVARERRAPASMLEDVDAELPPRGAVRRRRHACGRSSRALAPSGDAPHERQPARERRRAAARSACCPTFATTPSTCRAPGRSTPRRRACSARSSAT